MTLAEAGRLFDIPLSTLSRIERGFGAGLSFEIMARIEGATEYRVKAVDHFDAWDIANLLTSNAYRAAGRRAMAQTQLPARGNKRHGRKARGRR